MIEQTNTQLRFMICIKNGGCEDLSPRKVYQVLPDASAIKDDYIRIIDDSGQDYLYPADYFFRIELPQRAEQVLWAAA